MADLTTTLQQRASRLADDRESGAAEVMALVMAVLAEALAAGIPVAPLARTMCAAQPSMAPVWNAALEAVASEQSAGRFERFAQRVPRSAGALTRFALACFTVDAVPADVLRVVTISFSSSVSTVIEALAGARRVEVSCAESRPALEGRRLAARLSAAGLPVSCFADAAIAHALDGADAVLVGADAIGPEWFVNKSGTRMLAATAALQGVPVYVAGTRDKFMSDALVARLALREAAPAEVWDAAPSGVIVRNPYFETTPLDLVATVITDFGLLGAGMVPEVCGSLNDPQLSEALNQLDAGLSSQSGHRVRT